MLHPRSAVMAAVLFSAAAVTAGAQQQARQMPPQTPATLRGAGDTTIFADLNLYPSPNVYRTGDGRPGAKYWQQRADYDLHATLDTANKSLSASMTLRYTNNSPDTLRFIWVQTEQNAFRPNSLNTYVYAPGSRFGSRNFVGGDMIRSSTAARNISSCATTERLRKSIWQSPWHLARRRRLTRRGISPFRCMVPIAWDEMARCSSSLSGIRA